MEADLASLYNPIKKILLIFAAILEKRYDKN